MKRNRGLIFFLCCWMVLLVTGCGNSKAPVKEAGQPAKPAVETMKDIPSVWVTGGGIMDAAIYRLNPVDNSQLAKIPFEGSIRGITASHDAVWFTDFGGGKAVRIDPLSNKIVATVPVVEAPGPILSVPGSVWVASSTSGGVSRIDPATNKVVATIPVTNVSLNQLAFVDHMIWVGAVDFTVYQIDPQKNQVVSKINVGNIPGGLAGKNGNLWVSLPMANQLLNIDLATGKIGSPLPASGTSALALLPDGVAGINRQADGFSFFTGKPPVRKDSNITPKPEAVAVGFDSLWITSGDNNSLYRIALADQSLQATVNIKQAGRVAVTPQ